MRTSLHSPVFVRSMSSLLLSIATTSGDVTGTPELVFLQDRLRRAGLVESVRGPAGGYRLAKSPEVIRITDILEAVDETVNALHTGAGVSGAVSGSKAQSMTNRLWESLSAHVYVFLHQIRLSEVVQNDLTPCPAVPNLFTLVDED